MRREQLAEGVEPDDLTVGTAAEHIVCADLLLSGYRAFLAGQHCPFDVAVECGGRLVRVQVKATRVPKPIPQRANCIPTPAYQWFVRRAGKGGRRLYGAAEFDLLALVALDVRRIAYLPASSSAQTIHIRTHDHAGPPANGGKSGKTFGQYPFRAALEAVLNA